VSSGVRMVAAMALGRVFGPRAKEAGPALRGLLEQNPNEEERWLILKALAQVQVAGADLVPKIVEVLNDREQEASHASAISVLGAVGPDAQITIPTLMRMFPCKNLQQPVRAVDVQCAILGALGGMRTGASSTIPFVVRCCSDQGLESRVRSVAFHVLAEIDGDSRDALRCLVNAVELPDYGTYSVAVMGSLRRIGPKAVQALMDAYLRADEAKNKRRLIQLLGAMGHLAVEVLPHLKAARNDPKYEIDAGIAIGRITKKNVR